VLFATTGFAAKKAKVDICHFDMDYGVWKQISISGNAVGKHFNNHDDGLPDGETLGTTTLLDDGCEPVPLETCPCWTAEVLESVDGIHSDGRAMNVYTQNAPNNECQEEADFEGDWTTNYVRSWEDYFDGNETFDYCQSAAWSGPIQTRVTVQHKYYGEGDLRNTLTLDEFQTCSRQVQSCVTNAP